MPELGEIAEALKTFEGRPQKASSLASILGFEPVQSPVDLLSGQITPLIRFLDARFGADQLYRVGGIATTAGTAGLYVATLNDWGGRSSERDRPRRRLGRACQTCGHAWRGSDRMAALEANV